MSKLNSLFTWDGGQRLHRKVLAAWPLLLMLMFTVWSYGQQEEPPMIKCGVQKVNFNQALGLLCGEFTGAVDINAPDPRSPDSPLTLTHIDLGLVLEDNGSNEGEWRGYVAPAQSYVFPIVNPQEPVPLQRGPDVIGSHRGRTCAENKPCVLESQEFFTPVSGTNARRRFVLTITQIVYQDEKTHQIPRALIGRYTEIIKDYAIGRDIHVNGTFRLERSLPITVPPKS